MTMSFHYKDLPQDIRGQAARLAALSAGRAAGRSRATEKASSEEIRRSAAEAAAAGHRSMGDPWALPWAP